MYWEGRRRLRAEKGKEDLSQDEEMRADSWGAEGDMDDSKPRSRAGSRAHAQEEEEQDSSRHRRKTEA